MPKNAFSRFVSLDVFLKTKISSFLWIILGPQTVVGV